MSELEIRRIDIKKFGCYKDYNQHSRFGIGNDFNKERVNILYGRNYSGKSTYSKIFQSIELGKLPEKYGDIEFEIKLANQDIIKSSDVDKQEVPIDCRVFNQRFIDDNINLHSDNKLNSFQVTIGRDNNETIKKINELRSNKINPLTTKLTAIELDISDLEQKYSEQEYKLNYKLRNTASYVRNQKNPSVIGTNRYDIRDIKSEYKDFFSSIPDIPKNQKDKMELNEKSRQAKNEILQENIKRPEKIDLKTIENETIVHFLHEIKKALSKTVSVSNILDEYKNNPEKMNWIKYGVEIHGKNPKKCVFCGNTIDSCLIKNLELAFSEELKSLEKILEDQKEQIKIEIKKLDLVPNIQVEDYFTDEVTRIKKINQEINRVVKNRVNILKMIELKIIEKQRDIFSIIEIEDYSWDSLAEIQEEILLLHNDTIKKIEQFETRKRDSMDFLRRFYIAKMFPKTRYLKLSQKVDDLQKELKYKEDEKKRLEKEINSYEEQILKLEKGFKSQYAAVQKINKILQNSLAHSELFLESTNGEEENEVYYKVSRNGENAYNLSEGEKSLIAFAYYIARLESLSDEEKSKTILFIDDPISSLDENNIFYIYNLIYLILEEKKFLQYFLSTHNLDFLKYTNRFLSKKDYYLIEKIKESENEPSKSYIKKLPPHMSSKVTEFVFLFEQIYKVATEDETEENFSVFYNFPNNGRKFIEILLYFKYPDYQTHNDVKIRKFFGEENAPFIQRINNEYSHGEDRFDRTSNPVNTSEFQHDARLILSALYKKDPDQFNAFLKNSKLVVPSFLND